MKIAFYLAVLTPSNSKNLKFKAAVPNKDVLINNHSKLTIVCLNLKQMFQKRYCDVINREKNMRSLSKFPNVINSKL